MWEDESGSRWVTSVSRSTGAGLVDVQTLLQSGNVVFEAGTGDDARLVRRVISKEFGVDVTVIMRTAGQLRSIASKHPMATPDANGSLLHVACP